MTALIECLTRHSYQYENVKCCSSDAFLLSFSPQSILIFQARVTGVHSVYIKTDSGMCLNLITWVSTFNSGCFNVDVVVQLVYGIHNIVTMNPSKLPTTYYNLLTSSLKGLQKWELRPIMPLIEFLSIF